MKRRKMLIWRYLACRKKGFLIKILFVMVALCLAGGWILADATSKALMPPNFHQDLQHFRRNRTLNHYLDAIQVLIEPSSTACDKQNNVSLLVVVTSSPLRFYHRQAIRNSWAKHVPTYFFVGLNSGTIEDLPVDNYVEAKMYSDVVVHGFRDHYQNLTLKTVLMMRWALDRCPHARFLFKTDDDVLVNPWTMKKVLDQHGDADLVGYKIENVRLHRDEHNKWYLPRWLHYADRVPHYLSGTGYLVNGKHIGRILEAAFHVSLVNLEDVYLTYLVASDRLGLVLTHDSRLSPYKPWLRLPCWYWRLASMHSLAPDEITSAWPGLLDIGRGYETDEDSNPCKFYYSFLSSDVFLL